ncbi:26S proteasome non-ATPase regulatory subunit 9-like [Anneissia japonica]|uniref:26S proteasome non-ATPase regulatory subunit 9-like n=1 Tax=Anneissia japonica TaxID=1529436 RepID=UPI0014258252|nr:26S proteasome non-ATPase regulatory subunit 9-like [Anneissia japonica]
MASTTPVLSLEKLKEDVQTLIVGKEEIEKEIKELSEVLKSQKDVGMNGPLIDGEGYPRNDIDVYTVRTARHRIICLQNDYKTKMDDIEKALHELHGAQRDQLEKSVEPVQIEEARLSPFAKIDLVTPGSPAETGDFRVGDEVVYFGSVHKGNFKNIQAIGSIVQNSQGKPIRVIVLRDSKRIVLSLTPQRWSGRGLLGCNIVPLR